MRVDAPPFIPRIQRMDEAGNEVGGLVDGEGRINMANPREGGCCDPSTISINPDLSIYPDSDPSITCHSEPQSQASSSVPPCQQGDQLASERVPRSECASPQELALFHASDWDGDYELCAGWGVQWKATHTSGGEWPKGFQLRGNRMLFEGRICVPEARVWETMVAFHMASEHVGVERSVQAMKIHFIFPTSTTLLQTMREVRRRCTVCPACDPPTWSLKMPLAMTKVPDRVMVSVSLDVFHLPEVVWMGAKYDSMVVCVDRLSEWVIARPTQAVGLTAEKAAHLVMENGWETFGVPSLITSDRGTQFVGQWWKTMCARLGVRQAFSQAYRHQANGKAEVTGRVLKGFLRRIWVEEEINWVEALPRVLRVYHDLPGESGLSPFQILFGRERNLAGIPYPPEKECESAKVFFDRMCE